MCDTILAPPSQTAGGIMLFGKNSDRQRNEAQGVEYFPSADHAPDALLACTYITIPQVSHTHAVLLCRPFWIWGAEMGANEHGVVIGNEGLHARNAAPETPALIGMDLIRLALERASTAAEAVTVVTALLERYGQGGNCGHLTPNYYNNSFMIADAQEAFVLETIGREWVVARVRGVHAISNCYSIGQEADRASAGMAELVRNFGWDGSGTPDYAAFLADVERQHIGQACERRARAMMLLDERSGQIDAAYMMCVLRDHGGCDASGAAWDPESALIHGLCIHAKANLGGGQTTGSMVSELGGQAAVHWITGTAAACVSIFKPVLMDVGLPPIGPLPTGRFDPATLWWRHERLHRAALMRGFTEFLAEISSERDDLEALFRIRVAAVLDGGDAADRARVIARCWDEAFKLEEQWLERVAGTIVRDDTPFHAAWSGMNWTAGLVLT